MALRRGDLVTVALQGDYGKPRPGLVIQSDYAGHLDSVVVLPLTSAPLDAPLFRVTVEPSLQNGLRTVSFVMVDKPAAVKVEKVGTPFGRLEDAAMITVSQLLMLLLGLAG